MYRTVVRRDGTLELGEAARAAGIRPGLVVDVIVTSTGSLLVAVADEQMATLDLTGVPMGTARRAPGSRGIPGRAVRLGLSPGAAAGKEPLG